MGSVGENFRDYLQNRTDLSEAEQDMLAANDFDSWSGREGPTNQGVLVTKQEINRLERSVDTITSSDEVSERLADVDNMRQRGLDNFEQAARLDEIERRLIRLEDELRKAGR